MRCCLPSSAGRLTLVLGLAAALACHWVCGDTLGEYLGALATSTIILAGVEAEDTSSDAVGFLWAAMPWAAVQAANVITGGISPGQWAMLAAVLTTWLAMVQGLSRAVGAMSAFVVAALLLTWPVWTSAWLRGGDWATATQVLTEYHPLFAINRVVVEQGIWSEHRLAYAMTSLGDDVPYALPMSAWPTVMVQSALAAALSGAAWLTARRRVPA